MLKERHCSAQGVRAVHQRQNRDVIAGNVMLKGSIFARGRTFALMGLVSEHLRISDELLLYHEFVGEAIIKIGHIMI